MTSAVTQNTSFPVKRTVTKPEVQSGPVPSEGLAPIVAAQIAEQFRKFLLVISLCPQSLAHWEAVLQANSVLQVPGDQNHSTEHLSPLAPPTFTSIGIFVFGDVTVSFVGMEAQRNGKPVALTSKEFKTLAYMVHNRGRVISRDELLNHVWGYQSYPCTRTVDNHILRLRQKLEAEPSRPRHFLTVHGTGYKFLL